MCAPLVVNVEAHVEGYVGQTVSVVLHDEDCPGHAEDGTELEPHVHAPEPHSM